MQASVNGIMPEGKVLTEAVARVINPVKYVDNVFCRICGGVGTACVYRSYLRNNIAFLNQRLFNLVQNFPRFG